MTHVIEKLLHQDTDLAMLQVPRIVKSDVGERDVAAAAYVQGRAYELAAHLVVYYRGHSTWKVAGEVPADDKGWAVSLLVHNEDEQRSHLCEGNYDLTFAEAMAVFVQRVERQA